MCPVSSFCSTNVCAALCVGGLHLQVVFFYLYLFDFTYAFERIVALDPYIG